MPALSMLANSTCKRTRSASRSIGGISVKSAAMTNHSDTSSNQANVTPVEAAIVAGLTLALTIILLPHLLDEIWVDEAYTLLQFSSNGFLYAFSNYHAPNNHMLFSALLSAYWEPGMSQSLLRLPLLVLHVAGLGAIFLAARRLCGRESALIALALYGGSWATLSFVLELRGYGLSMVLSSLQMCGALAIMRKSAFSRYMLYFLPAWAAWQ
jgi:hypothetical protein